MGIGRSWTETLCGPSKTTAFMVVGDVAMALLMGGKGVPSRCRRWPGLAWGIARRRLDSDCLLSWGLWWCLGLVRSAEDELKSRLVKGLVWYL